MTKEDKAMTDSATTESRPKAWFDENYVANFRGDVPLEEAHELGGMLSAAFSVGFRRGYEQALKRQSAAQVTRQRYFGKLSFWRCMRHFGTYLRWLADTQDGTADASDPPDALRYQGDKRG